MFRKNRVENVNIIISGSPKQSFEFPSSVRHAEVPQYKDGWKSSPNVSQTKTTASPPSTSPPTHVSNTNQRYTILEGIKNAGLVNCHSLNKREQERFDIRVGQQRCL